MSHLFADLGLNPELARAVSDLEYTQPTPIQIESIPHILRGRDVLAAAREGAGKTAGFTLPLLQRLMETAGEAPTHAVRALIVTPTSELAAKVEERVRDYGKYLPLRSTVVFGGVDIGPQIEMLKAGADVLVATPGRLMDHALEQNVDLSKVEILVLDKADRMLDMGFIHDLRRILAILPVERQTLLFTSQFSEEIRSLATEILNNPETVEVVKPITGAELVNQRIHPVGQERKRALLSHLVKKGNWRQVLAFTRTKHGANRLAHQLCRSGIISTAIHGNKSQGARTKALADFKSGIVRVLVVTDLAARGLDIEVLSYVVNYDLPQVPEDYGYRIGKTGQNGSLPEVLSLVAPEEAPLLTAIEQWMGRSIELTLIPGFEPGSEPPKPIHSNQQNRKQPSPLPAHRQPQGVGLAADAGGEVPVVMPSEFPPLAPPSLGSDAETRESRGRRRNRGRNRTNSGPREGQEPLLNEAGVQEGQRVELVKGPRPEPVRKNLAAQRESQRESQREDRDNRGNRALPNRPRDNRLASMDDDFGNRIPVLKPNRSIRARIASGDIDEELDNIGNRLPPLPKSQRLLEGEEEKNFNVAMPEPQLEADVYDERQPETNDGQLFPSSAAFMGDGRVQRAGARSGAGHHLGGANKPQGRGNNNNAKRRGPAQRQGKGPGTFQRSGPGQGQGQGQGQGKNKGKGPRQGNNPNAQRPGQRSASNKGPAQHQPRQDKRNPV